MPLNQLGTLASGQHYGCVSVYYYLCCLSCAHPFHGAKENLKLLFLKNRKRYEEIKKLKNFDQSGNYQLKDLHSKEIKRFLVLFLHIIDLFLCSSLSSNDTTGPNTTTNTSYVQELCQMCLQDFNSCMFFKQDQSRKGRRENSNEKLQFLPTDLVFKLTLVVLMTIERMKKYRHHSRSHENKAASSKQENTLLFTAIAFAFVMFSHIVNHTIIRFQYEILNLQKPLRLSLGSYDWTTCVFFDDTIRQKFQFEGMQADEEAHDSEDSDEDDNNSESELATDDKRKKIRLIYGHRRRQRNSDSESSSQGWDNENYGYSRRRQDRKKCLSEDDLNKFENSDSRSEISSSPSSSPDIVESKEPVKEENLSNFITSLITNADDDVDFARTSNFKEFSTNLFEKYSIYQSKFDSNLLTTTQFNENNEFIDDEIYKSILNGQKQVSIPPGFEKNEKETREIEELGKKLATFQIETDTEMSVLNSDTSPNTSSSDKENEDEANTKWSTKKSINSQL